MKKIIVFLCAVIVFVGCCGFTYIEDEDANYMALMLECASRGDELSLREGAVYECLRNHKIKTFGYDISPTDFFCTTKEASDILDSLKKYHAIYDAGFSSSEYIALAKIIEIEAGAFWLPDYWKLSVGEVVLNRVASPEFPNTIKEVISQPNQYPYVGSNYYDNVSPSEKSFEIARRLLTGERFLKNASIVFQSNNSILGSGVAITFTDYYLGKTYFCYSYRPELYEVEHG